MPSATHTFVGAHADVDTGVVWALFLRMSVCWSAYADAIIVFSDRQRPVHVTVPVLFDEYIVRRSVFNNPQLQLPDVSEIVSSSSIGLHTVTRTIQQLAWTAGDVVLHPHLEVGLLACTSVTCCRP